MKHILVKLHIAVTLLFPAFIFAQVSKLPYDQRMVIEVGTSTTTMIVFPFPIIAADYGSGEVLAKPVHKDARILKIKASKKEFEVTNISVLTKEGKLYSIPIVYTEFPSRLIYNFSSDFNLSGYVVPVFSKDFNRSTRIQSLSKDIGMATSKRLRVASKNAMHVSLNGIYLDSSVLFFKYSIINKSHIPYHIRMIQCSIRDRKKSKKTSYFEKTITPEYEYIEMDTISGKANIILAFNQFTIADDKLFVVQFSELNGDRLIKLDIKGKMILSAKAITHK